MNLNQIGNILIFLGWPIAGILGVIGIFNKNRRDMRAQDDQTSANLIANLKTTTEIQKEELVSLRIKEVEQGKQIAHLEGQIKVLSDMVALRDPATTEVFKAAPGIFLIAHETNEISKRSFDAITALTAQMTLFIEKIIPHVNGTSTH